MRSQSIAGALPRGFVFCDHLAIFLLDGVNRKCLGFVENVHSILQDIYVGVVCQNTWIAEAENDIESLAVLCYGNDGEISDF